jgi:hypothetical protein
MQQKQAVEQVTAIHKSGAKETSPQNAGNERCALTEPIETTTRQNEREQSTTTRQPDTNEMSRQRMQGQLNKGQQRSRSQQHKRNPQNAVRIDIEGKTRQHLI